MKVSESTSLPEPPATLHMEHAKAPIRKHRLQLSLTLSQWNGDDDTVPCSYPEAVASDEQGCNPHEREAQLSSA